MSNLLFQVKAGSIRKFSAADFKYRKAVDSFCYEFKLPESESKHWKIKK